MSLRFRRDGTFYFLRTILVTGSKMGNLSKREAYLLESETQRNFLAATREFAGIDFILRCGSALAAIQTGICGPRVEVPLDGAETKSEDYQMDAGMCATKVQTIALN